MNASQLRAALGCGLPGCVCARGNTHCPVPTHGRGRGDRDPSLSVDDGPGGAVLVHCHAGCAQDAVIAVLRERGLWPKSEGGVIPPKSSATLHTLGCTLEAYATAKGLEPDFLRSLGVTDFNLLGSPSLRIPYLAEDGTELATRFRIALHGDNRFRWKRGSRPVLYGINRLAHARELGYAVLVEGESDCHVAWSHALPAVGVPGASNFREERDAPLFDDIPDIFVVVEPDQGGAALVGAIARSALRDRVHLVRLDGHKDLAELHLAGPTEFVTRWEEARASAVPLTWELVRQACQRREQAASAAEVLIRESDILHHFVGDLRRLGAVGEERAAQILFLAVVSRFLGRPISVAVKGPSSAGKSYVVEQTLRFFPADAYYALSGMSEHALAYGTEPLEHRMLVLYEAAGMSGEFATYLLRSLLSEGRVRYETVMKTANGLEPRLIERAGPTGLIVTTTAIALHPENETRLISVPVTDTSVQTGAILRALAGDDREDVDFTRWHALQEWLAGGDPRVVIPYAVQLSGLIPPVAVRLRRDFAAVLNLVRAHALLHQGTREMDADRRIVATIADYAAVRALVADLISDGIGATVPATIRETVSTVAALTAGGGETTNTAVAAMLGLDTSAGQRRVRAAIARGVVRNLEERRGRPARLVVGDPLPNDREILPSVERLQACIADGGDGEPPLPAAITDGRHIGANDREVF